jgi:predicted RNase H-like nuclease
VDACKKGWFAITLDRRGNWDIGIFQTVVDFWSAFRNVSLILIDIPIGLPYSGKRRCDTETRKLLGRRASDVFPVPCRKALERFMRKDLARDDILDAIVLAVSAGLPLTSIRPFPQIHPETKRVPQWRLYILFRRQWR